MNSDIRGLLILTTPKEQAFRLRAFADDGEVALDTLDGRFTHLVGARDGLGFWPLAGLLSRALPGGNRWRQHFGGYLVISEPREAFAAVAIHAAGESALVSTDLGDDAAPIVEVRTFDELFGAVLPAPLPIQAEAA